MHTLNELRGLPSETEVFEFKEAKNGYDFRKLGKYFSALSNEANLKGTPYAWLIFGIKDRGRIVVGSRFRPERKDLDRLKGEIAAKTTNRVTFIEIYELPLPDGRVVMLQIPAAPKGIPIAFEGHYYGREGEDLSPLNLEEIERIRAQAMAEDWSAVIVRNAAMSDLDPSAIAKARQNYKDKFPALSGDVDLWDDLTFLNKAKVTIKGKVTRAAIILLGRSESEHFISPAEAKIRWVLKDAKGNEKDYHIESCPLLLAVDKIYSKIRNLKYRYLKDGTLFPMKWINTSLLLFARPSITALPIRTIPREAGLMWLKWTISWSSPILAASSPDRSNGSSGKTHPKSTTGTNSWLRPCSI